MTITTKIQKLYNKLDFLQDNDRWVQYNEVHKEITELERLRDEIFNELQLINEFEADFNITPQSKQRREELTNKLQQLMDNNIN